MGRATKGLWKLGKGLARVTIGAVKGVYNVGKVTLDTVIDGRQNKIIEKELM